MARFETQVLRALHGRHPLLYVHTAEEDRVVDNLKPLLPRCYPNGTLTTWSCTHGFEPAVPGLDTRDPAVALQYMVEHPKRSCATFNEP